jgi:hypothetical protein
MLTLLLDVPRAADSRPAAKVSGAAASARAECRAPDGDTKRAAAILKDVEAALSRGDAQGIAKYFARKVYLNLFSGENGYYSSEQSFFILKNFLQLHRPVSFSFSTSAANADSPYGVGTLAYSRRGQRGSLQVFVSLTAADRDWKINQFTAVAR